SARVAPAPPAAMALRVVAVAAGLAALAQTATMLVALAEVRGAGGWPLADFFQTTFALTALARVLLAIGVGVLALRLARRAASLGAWRALTAGATLIVASSAVLSHAIARVDDRARLLALDGAHQAAAAVWIGGLAHLTLYAAFRARLTRRPRSVGARAAGPVEPEAHAADTDLDGLVAFGAWDSRRAAADDVV